MSNLRIFSICIIANILLFSCTNSSDQPKENQEVTFKRAGINEVIVHELSDPDKLNPVTSQGAGATYIKYNIFMYLLDIDRETLESNPLLAKERPTIKILEDGEYAGGLSIDYEIRAEAVWDNGDPVTAHDVAFTLKAIKNPLVDCEHLRPYVDFISHIEIDPKNDKKFTFFCKEPFFAAESSSGFQAFIAPRYIYDPKGLMEEFTLAYMSDPANNSDMRSNPKIIEFGSDFNSEKYQREPGFVVGCGPYELTEWTTSQRIVLTKKKNWWGDQLADVATNFKAYPDKIIYEIINDLTTTLTAVKDEQIDVVRGIRSKDFKDLLEDESFKQKFYLETPTALSYTYLGLNMKHPILSDIRVRKAMAHMVDRQQIIEVLTYGLSEPINGPFHPSKPYYNEKITAYDYDLKAATKLLEDAGWQDTDADGIRDKVIDGKKTPFRVSFKYNSGNDTREKIGLFFKENARKVGIDVEIEVKEWTVYLEEVKNHDFDIYCLGWVQDPSPDDPKQIWHTDSYNGGSNNVGFGDETTDMLIESIRKEMDEATRYDMYREFQMKVHESIPYIFLYTPKNRLVISKRFDNVNAYVARPGYTEREFVARKGVKK